MTLTNFYKKCQLEPYNSQLTSFSNSAFFFSPYLSCAVCLNVFKEITISYSLDWSWLYGRVAFCHTHNLTILEQMYIYKLDTCSSTVFLYIRDFYIHQGWLEAKINFECSLAHLHSCIYASAVYGKVPLRRIKQLWPWLGCECQQWQLRSVSLGCIHTDLCCCVYELMCRVMLIFPPIWLLQWTCPWEGWPLTTCDSVWA